MFLLCRERLLIFFSGVTVIWLYTPWNSKDSLYLNSPLNIDYWVPNHSSPWFCITLCLIKKSLVLWTLKTEKTLMSSNISCRLKLIKFYWLHPVISLRNLVIDVWLRHGYTVNQRIFIPSVKIWRHLGSNIFLYVLCKYWSSLQFKKPNIFHFNSLPWVSLLSLYVKLKIHIVHRIFCIQDI